MTNVPDACVLDWARLLSQRIPATLQPKGVVAGSIDRALDTPSGWRGEFHDTLELSIPKPANSSATAEKPHTETRIFSFTPGMDPAEGAAILLAPVNVAPVEKSPLLLSGMLTHQMYSLDLDGTTTVPELNSIIALLPPLGDGLAQVLPASPKSSETIRVSATCQRHWNATPVCTAKRAPEVARPHGRHRR